MKKLLIVSLIVLAAISGATAAEYPKRTITVVIPFGAGGETDIIARVLAKELGSILGVTIAPKNIVGAAGMNGCKAVVSAKPDGYTLGVIPSAPLVMHPHMRKLPYTLDEFQFIGRTSYDPYLVLVPKDSSWKDFQAMHDDMKASPGKYHWASCGAGSVPYFAGMDLFTSFGLDVKHVPFQGDSGALQALAAKRVNLYTTTAGVLAKHDLKALAILAPDRSDNLPAIPSITDYGQNVFYSQFLTLLGPKGMPAEVIETLQKTLAEAIASKGFMTDLEKLGMTPSYLDPVATTKFINSESERNAIIIKALIKKKL